MGALYNIRLWLPRASSVTIFVTVWPLKFLAGGGRWVRKHTFDPLPYSDYNIYLINVLVEKLAHTHIIICVPVAISSNAFSKLKSIQYSRPAAIRTICSVVRCIVSRKNKKQKNVPFAISPKKRLILKA